MVISGLLVMCLDGEGHQGNVLAGLGSQFLFQNRDGLRQILTAIQVCVIAYDSFFVIRV